MSQKCEDKPLLVGSPVKVHTFSFYCGYCMSCMCSVYCVLYERAVLQCTVCIVRTDRRSFKTTQSHPVRDNNKIRKTPACQLGEGCGVRIAAAFLSDLRTILRSLTFQLRLLIASLRTAFGQFKAWITCAIWRMCDWVHP